MHLVEDVSGLLEGTLGNLGAYVVGSGELKGITDVLTRARGGSR